MNIKSITLLLGSLLAALLSHPAMAALTVSPIFSSNMVLQRGVTVPVFGTGDVGTTVTVQFLTQTVSATIAATGKWQVNLAAMAASTAPSSMFVSSGSSSVTFTGVQVGEVWLCSGQSNMGKPLSYADGSAPYIADAANHNIRLFKMIAGNGPATTTWQISTSTNADDFSAVGYWMGLDLSEKLNVPIGLIQATHDGTSIDHWEHTDGGTGDDYDAMVRAIMPFAIKGVAWYQGESNGGDSNYQTELTDMLNEWRTDWAISPLPFGIIQLPAQKWTTARIAQFRVSQIVSNTFLVVTADLPGSSQLHPTAKYDVGIRCSLGARGSVYGEAIEYSGPVPAPYPGSTVSGTTVTINYTHTGNGLTTASGAPAPFQVAGSTGRYTSGTGSIVGNSIPVTSSVSGAKHVQYAFSAAGNVFNIVSVPIEGGTKTYTRLPGSLFQLDFP
ncbi:MAG TPA: sialate O-acetylesterase [Candidatus Dormibacteraeota bacterium]|nr:sialate O-acetylesterase [Candidatus Dormibacteraeota bacterium]